MTQYNIPRQVLVTVGPIPARLDAVKFITNKFKGGLAIKTALYLSKVPGLSVTIMGIRDTIKDIDLPKVEVTDVYDYYAKLDSASKKNTYDGYVLAAAVANLAPTNPYVGKFPSHLYKVGDTINIPFQIAPRAIDIIKINSPRSCLIGYKLLDGTQDELIKAGFKTLDDSKANLVVANNPNTAKDTKLMLTSDRAVREMDFDRHLFEIVRVLQLRYFTTVVEDPKKVLPVPEEVTRFSKLAAQVLFTNLDRYSYGSWMVRTKEITGISGDTKCRYFCTVRGKTEGSLEDVAEIIDVDVSKLVVRASKKATLNAAYMRTLIQENDTAVVIHFHSGTALGEFMRVPKTPYTYHGTKEDLMRNLKLGPVFHIEGHGYYMLFRDLFNAINTLESYR